MGKWGNGVFHLADALGGKSLKVRKYPILAFLLAAVLGTNLKVAKRGTARETGSLNPNTGLDINETLIVDGLARTSVIHLPAGYQDNESFPLVIMLHGSRLSGRLAEFITDFDTLANDNRFIVAYPNALHRQWNDGRRQGDTPSYGINDVNFISQYIDLMIQKYNADPKKIYLVGYSSGGMLAQKFGMEMRDKITAIAGVACSLPLPQLALNQKPTRPLSILLINGTQDTAFPWEGGTTRIVGVKVGPVAPVMDSVQYWIDANGGLTGEPVLHKPIDETMDVSVYPTQENTRVVLYKVSGGGHTWPGSEVPLTYVPFLGRKSKENASSLIWEFLKTY